MCLLSIPASTLETSGTTGYLVQIMHIPFMHMRIYNTSSGMWCPMAMQIWSWAWAFIQHAHPLQFCNYVDIHIHGTLLVALLIAHPVTPIFWWELLCGACRWLLWKARCSLVMKQVLSTPYSIIARIWHRLLLYIYEPIGDNLV